MKAIEYRPSESNTKRPFAFGPQVSNFSPSSPGTTETSVQVPTKSFAQQLVGGKCAIGKRG
jgi:hypothetical protein